LVPKEVIIKEVSERWSEWRMLAIHYIFEDIFWKRKTEKVEWLEELIRL
jgi:3-methyladenine DNA glycosylase/8-oxoguanine DNA glycosylase